MPFTIHDLPYMVLLDNIDLPNFGNLKFRGEKVPGEKVPGEKVQGKCRTCSGGRKCQKFQGGESAKFSGGRKCQTCTGGRKLPGEKIPKPVGGRKL